jgi:hypothetical protein
MSTDAPTSPSKCEPLSPFPLPARIGDAAPRAGVRGAVRAEEPAGHHHRRGDAVARLHGMDAREAPPPTRRHQVPRLRHRRHDLAAVRGGEKGAGERREGWRDRQ